MGGVARPGHGLGRPGQPDQPRELDIGAIGVGLELKQQPDVDWIK